MKNLFFFTLMIACMPFSQIMAQPTSPLNGAYLAQIGDITSLWLFADGYSSQILYKNKEYVSTKGGPYDFKDNTLTIQVEYNDADSTSVGKKEVLPLTFEGNNLKNKEQTVWKKQNNKQQALDGLWRITGRKQGDKLSTIARGDRKTIKILVDGYFQWIAINPAVKGFYGTGGGQYSFDKIVYTEQILFFSRDNTRVGNKLTFTGEIKDQVWHHSGKSSKGDPIYEIWSRER